MKNAKRAAVRSWTERLAGREVHVAVEACTGWLFVCDALVAADQQIRENVIRGQELMAADVIFSDGRNLADTFIVVGVGVLFGTLVLADRPRRPHGARDGDTSLQRR